MASGLAFATIGVLLATRRRQHPVGWLFLATGLVAAVQLVTGEYAAASLATSGPSFAVAVAAWVTYQVQNAIAVTLGLLMLLFPTGRPPSRRWWLVLWALAAGVVLIWVGEGLARARYLDFPGVDNPFGIASAATVLRWLRLASSVLVSLGFLGAVASLLVRFARARGVERQQLKWFVYVAVLGFAVLFVLSVLPSGLVPGLANPGNGTVGNLAWTLAPASLPAAAAVAILRYRLYDIDRLVNRTLVYGLVTALLGVVYAGIVLVLGEVSGGIGTQPPTWAVAGATLAAAALFQPTRRRIQQAVDRRFNRHKYDAAKTIEAFSARMRDEVDLDTLSTELLAVINQTMQPTRVSLWLRPSPHGSSGTARSEPRPNSPWAY